MESARYSRTTEGLRNLSLVIGSQKVRMESSDIKIFVVRYAKRFFFTRRVKGVPMGCLYPSQATAQTYSCAFAIAQTLRDEGFTDAIVCLPTGLPADVNSIFCARDVRNTEEFQNVWGEAPVAVKE